MVKIQQKVNDVEYKEIEKKETYRISKVEETKQQNFSGLSVEFRPLKETPETEKIKYQATLWYGQKGFVGSKSKLGAFITAFSEFFAKSEDVGTAINLAQDSDNWINHTIKVNEWREKENEIEVLS